MRSPGRSRTRNAPSAAATKRNAASNRVEPDLTLITQEAPGRFAVQPTTLATGARPRSIVARDLDGDGDTDLVCANSFGASLSLFLQDAPGVFTAQPPLPTGRSPFAVAADVDGDDDLDLLAASELGEGVTVLLQGPPGRFTPRVPNLAVGVPLATLAAGDLDGDGDVDLVGAGRSGTLANRHVTVLLQEASGSFRLQTGSYSVESAEAIDITDLDGDGDTDVAISFAIPSDGEVRLFWGGR